MFKKDALILEKAFIEGSSMSMLLFEINGLSTEDHEQDSTRGVSSLAGITFYQLVFLQLIERF